MLREMVGRIFGYQGEIEDLNRQVSELSWDEPFGMLTRKAFLRVCQAITSGNRTVIFVDLDNIGNLNLQIGYTEVDRRIRSTFARLRNPGELVGRWYSGDEIVIVSDSQQGATWEIEELYRTANNYGISFTSAIGEWEPGKSSILEVVERLSEKTCAQKRCARQSQAGDHEPGEFAVRSLDRSTQPESIRRKLQVNNVQCQSF